MTAGILRHSLDLNRAGVPNPKHIEPPLAALSRVATNSKRSHLAILSEAAKLRLGAGRLSLEEYLQLKLFDNDIYKSTDKKTFVGKKAAVKIWLRANYRVDLYALANNKIASDIWFAGHGFPILPTAAIFHDQVGRSSKFLLRSSDELRAFLRVNENYPLFGKPIYGAQSVGSASVEKYDGVRNCLVTTTGEIIPFDDFVSYVKTHAIGGYQFQPRVSPHAAVREICDDRLATVRLLTIMTKGKPDILRACWKIPAGIHTADNFWRPGNLLAQLDLADGRVMRVMRKTGAAYEEITYHPDTGARITGMLVPNWQDVTQLAIDCAKAFEGLPLVGWDIAPVDSGAVLVEPNMFPDFQIHQLADRRGMLDPVFMSFLRQRKTEAAGLRRAAKRRALMKL